jgi:hypothetical protein
LCILTKPITAFHSKRNSPRLGAASEGEIGVSGRPLPKEGKREGEIDARENKNDNMGEDLDIEKRAP